MEITNPALLFPYYRPLPWEIERCLAYAEASVESFKYISNNRSKEKKMNDAFIGALGELAFVEMLKNQHRDFITEWPTSKNEYGSRYDFKTKKDETIDIKTSETSDLIHSPALCNFVWGFSQANSKQAKKIDFCDYYMQMLYDSDLERIYFIGAVSYKFIKECDEQKKWLKRGVSYGVIAREEMDATTTFKKYFKDEFKTNWMQDNK